MLLNVHVIGPVLLGIIFLLPASSIMLKNKDFNQLNEVNTWHRDKWTPISEKWLQYRQLVTNANPICAGPYYAGQVQANNTAGTFITRAVATDPNNYNITWSIPDTTLQGFTINPNTGDIFTSRNLSARIFSAAVSPLARSFSAAISPLARSVIEFLVRATNSLGLTCDSLVRVSINVNPRPQTIVTVFNGTNSTNTPTFGQNSYSFSTTSCSSGNAIATITASNPGGGSLSYSILNNNQYSVSSSGQITLNGYQNFGSNNSFVLQATNQYGSAATTVYVCCFCSGSNSNYNVFGSGSAGGSAPTFSQSSYSVTITNCAVGASVGTLSAGNANSFAVISGNQNFGITSGGVVTIVSAPGVGSVQTITVQALNGVGSAYTSLTITANCNGTSITNGGLTNSFSSTGSNFGNSAYTFTLGSCSSGSTVGTVSASGGTYSIASSGTSFVINPSTGVITTSGNVSPGTQAFLVQAINGGASSFATVTVTATCNGATSSPGNTGPTVNTGAVTVPASTNGPPLFSNPNLVFNVSSCQPGAAVGTATASGVSGAFYSIASGGTGFAISSSTGAITVGNSGSTAASQAFLIQAVNSAGTGYATVTVYCSGGGSGGSASNYTFYPTSCGAGVIIGSVAPGGSSTGVTYTSNGLPYWTVDPNTGILTSATTVPNYDVFTVTAVGSSGTSTVTVTTSSNCPDYFTYNVNTCSPGTVVVPGSSISSLSVGGNVGLTGPQSSLFSITPNNGQIVTTSQIASGTYLLTITGTLVSGGSYSASVTLLVTCGGTTSSIIFSKPTYNFDIGCARLPTRVGVVLAVASTGESINYSLGAASNIFYIDPSSGEIRTQVAIRTASTQTFTVSAMGVSGTTTTVNVNVNAKCR